MTTITPADQSPGAYLGDRYDRLRQAAEAIATGTDFGDGFLTADIVLAFANNLTFARVLDGLTDHDANTVSMLVVLDILRGPARMAWRLSDWLSDHRTVDRQDDDDFAVVSVLARVLAIYCAAFVSEEFEKAQQHCPPEAEVEAGQ